VLAAKGDLDGAAAATREALSHHEDLEMPFERGRTLLAHGQILRRRQERRKARDVLEDALGQFAALGATGWADRAREELRRVPVKRSQPGLTATEENIARLAAAGLTNVQIAERAFISPKTVEANLSRAYAKLGVHSRAQLVNALAARDRQS
jgi:DNA-binding CsgD family transcriptional regulator